MKIELNSDLEEMLIFAGRYTMGRRTYAPGDYCDYITPLLPELSTKTIVIMWNDIEYATDFGDNCDERRWMQLKSSLEKEMVIRNVRKNDGEKAGNL